MSFYPNFYISHRIDKSGFASFKENSLWQLSSVANMVANADAISKGVFEADDWQLQLKELFVEHFNYIVNEWKKSSIKFYTSEGIYGNVVGDLYPYITSDEGVDYLDGLSLFVVDNDIINLYSNKENYEHDSLKKLLEGKQKLRTTNAPSPDKVTIQAVAKTLWHIYPDWTKEQIKEHPGVQVYAGGRLIKRDNTLLEWLGEVDQRDKSKKPGPKGSLD